MRLGFDVDGVFADFNENFVKLFPQCKFPPVGDDFPDIWDYPQKYGATKEENSAVWEGIKRDEMFWRDLPHYPGVLDVLARISILSRRHQIYYITSRLGPTAKWQTEQWLYNRGITYPTVLVVSDAEGQKPKLITGLKLHAYIDDKPETLDACVIYNADVHYYLFDRPWNRARVTAVGWLTRVSSVHQMLNEIGV